MLELQNKQVFCIAERCYTTMLTNLYVIQLIFTLYTQCGRLKIINCGK